jgi:hypothetical protein
MSDCVGWRIAALRRWTGSKRLVVVVGHQLSVLHKQRPAAHALAQSVRECACHKANDATAITGLPHCADSKRMSTAEAERWIRDEESGDRVASEAVSLSRLSRELTRSVQTQWFEGTSGLRVPGFGVG